MPRRALEPADAEAVLGTMIVVLGELAGGELPDPVARRLLRRFAAAGLVPPDAGPPQLYRALSDLVQRLHHLDDPDGPPEPWDGLVRHLLELPTAAAAEAVRRELGGASVREDRGRWVVEVERDGLPLSGDFARDEAEVTAVALRHGGTYGGSGH